MESVLEEYRSSLEELTFNSKPLINMLTVLAEENYSYASDLVRLIESQVYQSPPNQRLPVLYLIDSIVKSYSPYIKLFGSNLIKTFLFVFEKADTKVRQDLFKLRNTWNGMFPKSLLRDLDIAVRQFDKNWPIKKLKKVDKTKLKKDKSASHHPSGLTVEERVAAMVGKTGESSNKVSSDEDEYNAFYQEDNPESEYAGMEDYLVEEEEILVDGSELEALELEALLRKREAELCRLESKPSAGTSDAPKQRSPQTQVPYFIDAKALSQATEDSSHKNEDKDAATKSGASCNSTPDDHLFISERLDRCTQTRTTSVANAESQIVVETKDEATQFRYRKKTKNFLSQYRVTSKSVGTYFRTKTKEAQTQYALPLDTAGIAADSTSSHPDGGNGVFSSKERSALKDYVAALKDDFLPNGYAKHSGIALRNLCTQRKQGLLCDITLGAEGRVFKAHRSVLAASSDFFYTLFAHEELEKSPLSHIELQGITAQALSLVLDYIYTSVLPIGSLSCVEEIRVAAKRLQIQTLMMTCPALERVVARKIDVTGWLISNAVLLSPSNKHPYVEALKSLKDLESSSCYLSSTFNRQSQSAYNGAGDSGAADFICHVDRDTSSKKRTADMAGCDTHSNDEGKYKKRRKHDRGSETESDVEISNLLKDDNKKEDTYRPGTVASPGMPPSCWADGFSPVKSSKKQASREQAVFQCNNCKRFIISRRNYIAHCDAHLRKGEKPYGCSLCKKTFWKEPELEAHIRKVHFDLSEDQIQTMTKSKMSSMDAEQVLKQRELEQFSPSAAKKSNKVQSRNTPDVTGELRFKCKTCKQRFKTSAARNSHAKKHKKEGLRQSTEMNSSENSSSSDEDEFGVSSDDDQKTGKKTQETVTKLKLYHCKICGEMFSIQCFYKAHLAQHKRDLEEK